MNPFINPVDEFYRTVYTCNMPTPKTGSYQFLKESLIETRRQLGLSQSQMATKLGVLQNSLSRWETGSTTPDAKWLARIYSVAMEGGYMPTFFAPVRQKAKVRDSVLVFWDGLSVAPMFNNGDQASRWIVDEAKRLAPNVKHLRLKAFLNPSQQQLASELEAQDWRIWQDDGDWFEYIFSQAASDSGQDPDATVVLLITVDPDFSELIKELHKKGVQAYVITPSQPFLTDRRLHETVREGHVITPPIHLLSENPRLLYDRSRQMG